MPSKYTTGLQAKLKKKLLDCDRKEWDPLHPGPLAHEIKPRHIAFWRNIVWLLEITEEMNGVIKGNVIQRSPQMEKMRCDGCYYRHRGEKNYWCGANKESGNPVFTFHDHGVDVYEIWDLEPPRAKKYGLWKLTKLVADWKRHTSATVEFTRIN